jgi:arginine decarboxylase
MSPPAMLPAFGAFISVSTSRRLPRYRDATLHPRCCAENPSDTAAISAADTGTQQLQPNETTPLLSAVQLESSKVRVNLFCPGHKQGAAAAPSLRGLVGARALRHDVPELPALDNLFAADGVIDAAQRLATEAFVGRGALARGWSTFFLVNGSTCGVEAAILACVRPGRTVLLPRNVHQSAIHALVLSGGVPAWIDPVYDAERDLLHGVAAEAVAATLDANTGEVDAVLVVSPTYHGVCSDVAAIAALAHAAGVPLLVDEAHGAHLAFHPALPAPAAACGADVVVQSTHKTLGAMTQSAMMHVRCSGLVQQSRVAASLQLVQSTSPSYLLLSSLDAARDGMSRNGRGLLDAAIGLAGDAARRIAALEGFSVLQRSDGEGRSFFALDPTRVTILLPRNVSGYDLDEHLIDRFGVYAELPAFRHITLVFTPGNTKKDVDTLLTSLALFTATAGLGGEEERPEFLLPWISTRPGCVMTPRDAFFAVAEVVASEDAIGRVSADTLCPYPPGIPILLPGEKITEQCVDILKAVLAAGGSVSGARDEDLSTLRVVQNVPLPTPKGGRTGRRTIT